MVAMIEQHRLRESEQKKARVKNTRQKVAETNQNIKSHICPKWGGSWCYAMENMEISMAVTTIQNVGILRKFERIVFDTCRKKSGNISLNHGMNCHFFICFNVS